MAGGFSSDHGTITARPARPVFSPGTTVCPDLRGLDGSLRLAPTA
jgi:hypothetical protein